MNKALIKENVKDYNAEQSRILEVLWEEGSISNKEISQKSGLALNTLTTMLNRMEDAGLIMKEVDENDRRKTIVSLTRKSKRLKKKFD
ncbi:MULTISPECIES: MarR family transcriptional regulator [unclassified Leptotrichia]|uniref:MarR family transcriptional regulator n=1 Tax=unclassified Leptotrichia TaxID=2633022 RepID=UPI0017DBE5DA|nr:MULTISPECIES: MarR family transcriptional regulator [unclassified Leptotrichia]MBB1534405.1 MarR family transcriptional regulator [Leptotrichia sp.]QUB96762.1 MarR family transcriptional regulator [Leptotrichia sp. oral taxon 221]